MITKLQKRLTSLARHVLQEPIYLYGVNTTCSRYLNRPEIVRAAQFAAAAHEGQARPQCPELLQSFL